MPWWAMVAAIMCLAVFPSAGECPGNCECKWKSGKESVLCAGRNLLSVPQHLDSGTQLLDLSNNNLSTIREDEFYTAQLINLQKVFLSRCSLRTLHRSAFRNLINLVDLDLSFNLLTSVPSHTFDFIPLLTDLKLNGNPIAAVRNNSFKSVPQLNKLDLSECRIVYLELNAFAGVESSLEWLKLDKNRMTSIRGDSVMVLGNLKGLELAGNPWNCSCGLRPLREWVLKNNIPHTVSPVCKLPERLKEKQWDKLDLDEFACLPRVAALQKLKQSQEGSNVTLHCLIRSIPMPVVKWLRREKLIGNLSGFHGGKRHLFTVHVSSTGSNLTISNAELVDSGDYTCRAENRAGKSETKISLTIIERQDEPPWSTRVILATAAVVILFSLAAVLLMICVCCLWKKQRFHRHGNMPSGIDAYEMNSKSSGTYDKVIRYGTDTKIDDNLDHGGRECKNGYIPGMETEMTEKDREIIEVGNGKSWGSAADRGKREQIADGSTPDLHIPRVNDYRQDDNIRRSSLSPTSELIASTPGVKTHIMRKEVRGPNRGTLYTSCSDPDNYPDLLDNDKSTLPRKGYRPRRTRTASFGSESMSPLLQGSSDESCDSTPLPLLDIPDPYPELDKFLKEYRNLQEQLYKMKESCENLKQENLRFKAESASSTAEPKTISRLMDDVYKTTDNVYSVYNTTAVDPLFTSSQHLLNDSLGNVLLSSSLDNNNPRVCESMDGRLSEPRTLNSELLKNDPFWVSRRKNQNEPNPNKSLYES